MHSGRLRKLDGDDVGRSAPLSIGAERAGRRRPGRLPCDGTCWQTAPLASPLSPHYFCGQVDAFTHGKHGTFTGNPAAVVLVPKSVATLLTDELLQKIAAENNLSETAFVEWDDDTDRASATPRFGLRWFTPAMEVPLCGHATLASAAALFIGEGNSCSRLTFDTLSRVWHICLCRGQLSVARASGGEASGSGGDNSDAGATQTADMLAMDLPLIEAKKEAVLPGMEAGSELVKVGQ